MYKILTFVFLISLVTEACIAKDDAVSRLIQEKIEHSEDKQPIEADGISLKAQLSIPIFYKNRSYEPAWHPRRSMPELIQVLESAFEEGLLPADYHLNQIHRLFAEYKRDKSPEVRANLDLLCTDGLLIYAAHLLTGKVDQSKIRPGWELAANTLPENGVELLEQAIASENVAKLINSLKPNHFMYIYLRSGLKEYREIAAAGSWPEIPEGKTLKSGMTDHRIPTLINYLKITGDLDAEEDYGQDSVYYDDIIEGVKRFQFRHNLKQDGVIGKGTLAMMNIPIERRIDEIRINLERARWVTHHLPDDFMVVNIAGFNIRRITNDSIVYYSRVIVGKHYHETPVFSHKMTYIEINPTWTLPYSIATKETLPKLKKNPNYLAEKHMIIMDRDGNKLDPESIDFNSLSRKSFPYILRQEAGPHNALGQVKFMFPNKHAVYLHDTPARSLFAREDRAFSHGCIRLEKKWELLQNLMDYTNDWSMDRINEILDSEKTTRVKLKKPIDILLLYWTAGADTDNKLYFNKDVYDRDATVLKELDRPLSE